MFVITWQQPSSAECRKEKDKELKLEEEEVFRSLQERKEEEENRSQFAMNML
jgi:hypothetical protein